MAHAVTVGDWMEGEYFVISQALLEYIGINCIYVPPIISGRMVVHHGRYRRWLMFAPVMPGFDQKNAGWPRFVNQCIIWQPVAVSQCLFL